MQLFTPVTLGRYTLDHRVVLAPTTRLRSEQPSDTPSDMMATFYSQRATRGGLLIAEATGIARSARSNLGAPGIYTDEHVVGWRKVTDAVHAKGGRIFLQLFHPGRQAHSSLIDGLDPVAPSVVTTAELITVTEDGWVQASPHRALDIDEIPGIVEDYHAAAQRAVAAGFDGVEVHGANGYLIDEFLQDGSNKRTDAYGGPVENRARFLFEVLDAVIGVWSADRVGLRISPSGTYGDMSDSDPQHTFGYVAERADPLGLAYLHIIEPRVRGNDTLVAEADPVASADLRKRYGGTIIAAGGFNGEGAEAIVGSGAADLVAFGRLFTSNPDLPRRLRLGYPLTHYDRSTFWGGTEQGYTDFPDYAEPQADASARLPIP
ncbi:MAG: alkene reductase [Mycolicibacterium rufum]|nr:alkene reductase [Mycolicibacterium rufum]